MSSKIKVDTIENVAGSGNVSLGSGHNLVVPGTVSVTGATTATGGVTIPASTTVGLNLGSGTNLAQLAMQSAVLNRVALRTTHTSTGDNNPFIIYQPSDVAAQNDALVIDGNGHITMSKTPAFLVTKSTPQSSIPVDTNLVIAFDTERFDQNGDFSSNTFTAPVTGRYQFNVIAYTADAPNDLSYFTIRLVTSNREYYAIFDPGQAGLSGANAYHTLHINVLADMDANDTAFVNCYTPSGTAGTKVDGSHVSSFSGFLAC